MLFVGDSITDAHRGRPVGRGASETLGTGYVSFVHALLTADHPELEINVLNTGVCKDSVRHLKSRWKQDVLDLKPDWLSIMIGINDTWRQCDDPAEQAVRILPEEYDATLRELIAAARVRQLVLMTPFFVELDRSDATRRRVDECGAIVRAIAREVGAILVDTQAAFDKALQVIPREAISEDRVHPGGSASSGPVGHMILALAFLDAVGLPCRS